MDRQSRLGPVTHMRRAKIAVDILMTLFLPGLMAYPVTGELVHEWLGTGMCLLFLLHHVLNLRWYGGLARGKYRFLRMFRTAVNMALLLCVCGLGYSGVILSRHVFSFLPGTRGMALARVMHMTCAYWGLVLMSIHLGLHWNMIAGRLPGKGLRVLAALFAGFGAICFYQADIVSYLFLKVEFVFFDYNKPGALMLLEYAAMMGFWVFMTHYGKGDPRRKKDRANP